MRERLTRVCPHWTIKSRWRAAAVTAVALVAVGATAGCSADDAPGAAQGHAAPAPTQAPGEANRAEAAPGTDSGADSGAAAPQKGGPADTGGTAGEPPVGRPARVIVRNGDMTVRVKNVSETADRAATITDGLRGFVAGDSRSGEKDSANATLVLRVPLDGFPALLRQVSDLGDELSRSLDTKDVTDAVVDIDARITSQAASVARTRALLAKAQRIEDIVTIERELATRESELASLQAQQRGLEDQVAYSTLTLSLVGKHAKKKDEPDTGFVAGLKDGWHAFTASVSALLTVTGALLPFLVAIAVPVVLVLYVLRRRRAVRPTGSSPTNGPVPPTSGPPASGPPAATQPAS
jgi:hypothetical protein